MTSVATASSTNNQNQNQNLIHNNNNVADLWTNYWSGNPLIDVWHCQTFARMTAKNFNNNKNNNSSTWSPEIKKMLETVSNDLRVKQLRTFFARQQQQQQESNKVVESTDAAPTPSSTIEISTCSSSQSSSSSHQHIHPRDVFDLYQTLLVSTRDQQQTTILDFEFNGQTAKVTFANPLIAQRVAASLQGIADVRILSTAQCKQQRPLKNHSLWLRGSGLANLYNQVRIIGFAPLFSIFGDSPKIEIVSTSPVLIKIDFGSSSNKNTGAVVVAPSVLQVSPQEEFLFSTTTASTNNSNSSEDAAADSNNNNNQNSNNDEKMLYSSESLEFLASSSESALNALVHLQRSLAEDWGFMLTFEREPAVVGGEAKK